MRKISRILTAVSSVIIFIFALQLLGESTSALGPVLNQYLRAVITSDLSALGSGWLSSYILLNGSTIAAVGLAFLKNGIIDVPQYFMIASGSRLGAAFIVTLLGAIEYFQDKNESLTDSMSIGILSFLVTYSVYIPATVLGYFLIKHAELEMSGFADVAISGLSILSVLDPAVQTVMEFLNPGVGFVVSLGLLFFSLKKFDTAFSGLGAAQIRNRYVRFMLSNKWISFAAGALMTLLTFSVSLSLGLIVPLYNRGYIKREEIIPYMMGANITTLMDTVLAATVLKTSQGLEALLVLAFSATVFTAFTMIFYDRYFKGLKYVFDRIITDNRFFMAFAAVLTLTPLVLLFL